jgi:uncharacterized membrane protein YqiK
MKENLLNFAANYWWIIFPILFIFFYKTVFRLFGIVIIPDEKLGLITKKFVLFGKNANLPDGRIIALNGEAGLQAQTLSQGIYYWKWPWQYHIEITDFTVVPQGHIGLVSAKDGIIIPTGTILGRKVECESFQNAELFLKNGGMKGRQVDYITNGTYKINKHLFDVKIEKMTIIEENKVGIITALDGLPLTPGQIAGPEIHGHNNFQDFETFLKNGGQRGLQTQVILSGSYNINPWAITIEQVAMTEIPIGHVGVVISYVGEEGKDVTGEQFKHGNLVSRGQKGVWVDTFGPGKYGLNTRTIKTELVPTTNLVLNWANARTESHSLDKHLSTITVRSKDGFPFNLDVSQIIHIPMTEAPKVIARFGNMNNLVSQVLEPTIGNYFRNSAQTSDVLQFLTARSDRQKEAKQHIDSVLKEYNVQGVDTLIGDIVPPEAIMKTLSDRKIAEEQKATYEAQMLAQQKRQDFEKSKAIADMQPEIVKANQGVEIAEKTADAEVKKATGAAKSVELKADADAKATKLTANAEAEKIRVTGNAQAESILAIGKSTAESYELQAKAMGENNFATFKITESIGTNKIKVTPDVLVSGGNGSGPLDGLLAMQLQERINLSLQESNSKVNVSTNEQTQGKGNKNSKDNPSSQGEKK